MQHDSGEWRAARNQFLNDLIGDADAVAFLLDVFDAVEFFDDIIDEETDSPEHKAQAVRVLFSTLIDIPNNPFFVRFRNQITPVMLAAINAWLDSVSYEGRGDDESLARAYMLRTMGVDLIPLVVCLVHGRHKMRETSLRVRDFFHAHETLADYLAEHNSKGE